MAVLSNLRDPNASIKSNSREDVAAHSSHEYESDDGNMENGSTVFQSPQETSKPKQRLSSSTKKGRHSFYFSTLPGQSEFRHKLIELVHSIARQDRKFYEDTAAYRRKKLAILKVYFLGVEREARQGSGNQEQS